MCSVPPLDPVPKISSGFGPRGSGWHAGIDLPAPVGTPVQAVASGVVVRASAHPVFGRVVLQRLGSGSGPGLGVYAVYAHLEIFAVRPGELIAAGDRIGTVGSTGRSTGPHLHFSLLRDVPDAKIRRSGPIGVRELDYAIDPTGVSGCSSVQ
ncbi:M23 family metallopeptidase [Algihabitans albus]|uniref:M23 family metallopeptidase n=1 Tax=Algihabitans albus TaxID=2164067 RepID=UPI000E5D7A63